jgi:hypothetical protein
MNEFPSQPWDFFSDATGQINAFVQKGGDGEGVDGDMESSLISLGQFTDINVSSW